MNPTQAIITNVIALLATILLTFGIEVTPEQQASIGAAGMAIIAIINGLDNYVAKRKEVGVLK